MIHTNKEWLYNRYITNKLSSVEIGNMVKRDKSTILHWLHRHNIPVRSNSKSKHIWQVNHFTATIEFKEWLNGELLGDGCVSSRSNYSAFISYGSKYLEYIDYVSGYLNSLGIEQCGNILKYKTNFNKCIYSYQSKWYAELKDFHNRWYLNGKKIVPRDLQLTPITLRQWYIGDGHLSNPKKGNKYINLASYAFTEDEIYFLIELLKDVGIRATKPKTNIIHISTKSTKDFLDYIGKCPVYCYQYKWEY